MKNTLYKDHTILDELELNHDLLDEMYQQYSHNAIEFVDCFKHIDNNEEILLCKVKIGQYNILLIYSLINNNNFINDIIKKYHYRLDDDTLVIKPQINIGENYEIIYTKIITTILQVCSGVLIDKYNTIIQENGKTLVNYRLVKKFNYEQNNIDMINSTIN